jgi:hypothetical protein
MILITGMYDVKPEGMPPITERLGDAEPSVYTQLAVESILPTLQVPKYRKVPLWLGLKLVNKKRKASNMYWVPFLLWNRLSCYDKL